MANETERGPRVVFVPVGGTTGQVLAKTSNDNFDAQWVDAAIGGYLGSGYLGSGDEAAMLAVMGTGVEVGARFLRTDLAPAHEWVISSLSGTNAAATLANWRSSLPIDPIAPVMTMVGIGSSSIEGNTAIGTVTTMSRTSNVLTVNGTTPLGGNYVGQKVRLFGMAPADLPGVYEKLTIGTNTFTVASVGPDLADGAITAAPQRRFRPLQVEPRTSPYWWATQLASQRAVNLGNRGIPGATIEQCSDAILRDVAPLNPTRVVVMVGGNNVSAYLAGTPAADAAAAFAPMPALVRRLVALGVQIDLCALWPLGADFADHAAWNARAPLFNALMADLAAQYPDNCAYIDFYNPVVSDIGGGEQGMSANLMGPDGVHMRNNCAFILGRVLYNSWVSRGVLGRRYSPERVGTLLDLTFRSGSGDTIGAAGGSGVEATTIDIARDSGSPTFVGSLVLLDTGDYAQRVVITPATTGFEAMRFRFPIDVAYAPKGSRWRFKVDFATEAAQNGFGSWSTIIRTTVDSVANLLYIDADATGNVVAFDEDSSFTYLSPEFQIPNPAGGAHTLFQIDLRATLINGTAPFTVEISKMVLTRVG